MEVCPHCGHPVAADTARRALTPMQREMFDVLDKAGAAGITRERLFWLVYNNRIDGGPHPQVLNTQASNMRIRLKPFGLTITSSMGHGSIWRLAALAPPRRETHESRERFQSPEQ